MRVILFFVLLLPLTVVAQEQSEAGEVLTSRWSDPTTAVYNISCSAERVNVLDDNRLSDPAPVHTFAWYGIDYVSWLYAEQGMLWVQAAILEAWKELAIEGDETYQALSRAYDGPQIQIGPQQ